MRISDWSSDVCSSDLNGDRIPHHSDRESRSLMNAETKLRRGLTHLEQHEAESIHIMREVVAETERPVMLYSVGKHSAVLLHLARTDSYPATPPSPPLHVDTTSPFQHIYPPHHPPAAENARDIPRPH